MVMQIVSHFGENVQTETRKHVLHSRERGIYFREKPAVFWRDGRALLVNRIWNRELCRSPLNVADKKTGCWIFLNLFSVCEENAIQ